MSRPPDTPVTEARGARDLPAPGHQGGHARRHRHARHHLCRHADGRELPDRRRPGARAGDGGEQGTSARRGRERRGDDAGAARRVAGVDRADGQADRSGDDLVARGAEGVQPRRREAQHRQRPGSDPALPRAPSSSIRTSRWPTRGSGRCTRTSARRNRRSSTARAPTSCAIGSASANASTSPGTTTAASRKRSTRRSRPTTSGSRPTRAIRCRTSTAASSTRSAARASARSRPT